MLQNHRTYLPDYRTTHIPRPHADAMRVRCFHLSSFDHRCSSLLCVLRPSDRIAIGYTTVISTSDHSRFSMPPTHYLKRGRFDSITFLRCVACRVLFRVDWWWANMRCDGLCSSEHAVSWKRISIHPTGTHKRQHWIRVRSGRRQRRRTTSF